MSAKKPSLSIMAGKSDQLLEIGGIIFMMAPLTMREYIEYENLKENLTIAEQANWIAAKLKLRVYRPTSEGNNPDDITPEWVLDNIPMALIGTIRYILLHGELPTKEDEVVPKQ